MMMTVMSLFATPIHVLPAQCFWLRWCTDDIHAQRD